MPIAALIPKEPGAHLKQVRIHLEAINASLLGRIEGLSALGIARQGSSWDRDKSPEQNTHQHAQRRTQTNRRITD